MHGNVACACYHDVYMRCANGGCAVQTSRVSTAPYVTPGRLEANTHACTQPCTHARVCSHAHAHTRADIQQILSNTLRTPPRGARPRPQAPAPVVAALFDRTSTAAVLVVEAPPKVAVSNNAKGWLLCRRSTARSTTCALLKLIYQLTRMWTFTAVETW